MDSFYVGKLTSWMNKKKSLQLKKLNDFIQNDYKNNFYFYKIKSLSVQNSLLKIGSKLISEKLKKPIFVIKQKIIKFNVRLMSKDLFLIKF